MDPGIASFLTEARRINSPVYQPNHEAMSAAYEQHHPGQGLDREEMDDMFTAAIGKEPDMSNAAVNKRLYNRGYSNRPWLRKAAGPARDDPSSWHAGADGWIAEGLLYGYIEEIGNKP